MVNHLLITIKDNIKTFISIMLLTMLGVGFLVGMKSTVPNLKTTVEKYYNQYNVFDLELTSSIGFSKEDIESFKKISNIESIEGSYTKDFVINGKKEDFVLRVHSYQNNKKTINQLELLEGKLPTKQNEIVVERSLFRKQKYKLGDTITLKNNLIKEKELKIVGIIKSPLYLSSNKGSTSLLSGKVNYYAFINVENVNSDLYSSLYIKLKDQKKQKETIKEIKNIGKDSIETKYNSLIQEYKEKIEKGQSEIDTKKKESEEKIANYEMEIANAELQIESAEESIPSLEEARNILGNKHNELNKVKQELDSAKAKIDNARNEYNNSLEEYNYYANIAQQLENSEDPVEQFFSGLYQSSLYYAKINLDNAKSELDSKEYEYNLAYSEYQRVENTLNASSPEELIDNAKKEVQKKKDLLNEKKKELEEGKKRAEGEFISFQNQLDDAKDYLKLISVNGWTIKKREDISSYNQYLNDITRVEKIGNFFPILFYLVAVLITLTNITRIITKDREKIGLYKALGYSNKEVQKNYITFSILSCIVGSLIGIILGIFTLPKIFYKIYQLIYYLPKYQMNIQLSYILIAFIIALILIIGSTILSIKSTIKEWPTTLLRPKEDKKGKRVILEKTPIWKELNFTNKVTYRNMFKYPKRFMMMILGISGCIALIIAGFNIRTSITNIIPLQFENIFDIDAEIFFKDSISRNQIIEEKNRIGLLKEIEASILSYVKYATINDSKTKINLVVPEDKDLLLDFVLLEKKHELVELTEEGAIITSKVAETLKIKIGDEVTLKDAENNVLKVKITNIVDNYVDNYIYISQEQYTNLVGSSPKYNALFVRMRNKNFQETEYSKKFNKNNSVSYLVYTSSSKKVYENLSKSLSYIVYILVLSAIILAFVVIYNLNTLNIEERKREIATIKVLGFNKKETYKYIENETKKLTILGIIIGLFLGYIFSYFLIKSCELENLRYDYSIHIINYIYAVLITIFFMIIASLLCRKSIKKINMIESLKKVE